MQRKQEIEREIWNIRQTLTLARECYEYAYYLYKPETKKEKDYMDFSVDFAFIRNILWRTVIIELAKLVREPMTEVPHIFNIRDFIQKFRNGGAYENMGISEEILENWEKIILMNRANAGKILIIWDKLYALSEADNRKYLDNDISFEEIERLITGFETIIKELYSKIFNLETLENSRLFDKKRFNILKILTSGN
jgi:hypothetical protein